MRQGSRLNNTVNLRNGRSHPDAIIRLPAANIRHPDANIRHPDAKGGISSRDYGAGVWSAVGMIGTLAASSRREYPSSRREARDLTARNSGAGVWSAVGMIGT
jgi:hypothetical protein